MVDTGGILGPTDEFSDDIKAQALIAIEEADLIAFLVDIHDGILQGDKEISRILRKSQKKVIVLANKAGS